MNQKSCPLCYNEVDHENILSVCSICGLNRCSECEPNSCCETVCALCFKYKLTGDGNDEKNCEICDKVVCFNCVAVTGCQTVDGTCKACFDYLCVVCRKVPLNKDNIYLVDMKEHFPTCEGCRNTY